MAHHPTNKRKILNDPVYGFISLNHDILLDLIDHRFFQRLRRINQLGLTQLVYPGALHNRFHHAIGAMHLMSEAIEVIRQKGQEITDEEAQGVLIAILLHDIGHGPFSHALEHSLVEGVSHEEISALIMSRLNEEMDGRLEVAIRIFNNDYPKNFLHQLVSSQLDMDRLDYLRRDSFYTGVAEGNIGSERIIKMLNVANDELVVESKGIYSIEKFIVSRRLMYWQVYLHKTVLSAEFMLVNILKRAKWLADNDIDIFASPVLKEFLYNRYGQDDFQKNPELLDKFALLDDFDIMGAIKVWTSHEDKVLALLSKKLMNRELFKIRLQNEPIPKSEIEEKTAELAKQLNLSEEDASYFVISRKIDNRAYNKAAENIKIQFKDGTIKDATEASDNLNLNALSETVEKYFISYPVKEE
ncbi:HD domain-containing protein [Halocola ammonii]